jgi:hypothetical protein
VTIDTVDEVQPSEGRTEPDDDRGRPSVVSPCQRSESGQGILGVKEGNGKYDMCTHISSTTFHSFCVLVHK